MTTNSPLDNIFTQLNLVSEPKISVSEIKKIVNEADFSFITDEVHKLNKELNNKPYKYEISLFELFSLLVCSLFEK